LIAKWIHLFVFFSLQAGLLDGDVFNNPSLQGQSYVHLGSFFGDAAVRLKKPHPTTQRRTPLIQHQKLATLIIHLNSPIHRHIRKTQPPLRSTQ